MVLDNYSVDELQNYRIKKIWRYKNDKNVEYHYLQRKSIFGWVYIDDERWYFTTSTFGPVATFMCLICIGIDLLAGFAASDTAHFIYSLPALLLGALISLIIWANVPYAGKEDINDIKDIIDKRIRYRNRKRGHIETLDVSIKVQRKKKLDKLNNI